MISLIDLALVIAARLIALVARTPAPAGLAVGLYGLLIGVGLIVVPLVGWEAARSDNAFLGLYLIALLAFLFGAVLTLRAALRLRGGASVRQGPWAGRRRVDGWGRSPPRQVIWQSARQTSPRLRRTVDQDLLHWLNVPVVPKRLQRGHGWRR